MLVGSTGEGKALTPRIWDARLALVHTARCNRTARYSNENRTVLLRYLQQVCCSQVELINRTVVARALGSIGTLGKNTFCSED